MTELKRLRDVIQRTPIVDNHAHNLLLPTEIDNHPFHLITTEAQGEALKDVFTSLSHLRACKQLKELYEDEGPDREWTWERLLEIRKEWVTSRLDELNHKCLEGTHVILMDDGLTLGEVHPYQWHDSLTKSPTRQIFRIEKEAELIMQHLLAGAAAKDTQSEEFYSNFYNKFAETFDQAIKERIADSAVVSFKSVICYRSGLNVNPNYDAVVQQVREPFQQYIYHAMTNADDPGRLRFDYKPLTDFLLHKTLQLLSEHDRPKPIQLHTGLGDNDMNLLHSNPAYLQPLIEAYHSVPFILLHSAYPYTREAGYLTTVFKNVYLDLGEVFPMLSTDGQEEVLRQAMELTPANKLLWSTDGHLFGETYWLANKQFREALEEVMCKHVAMEDMTESKAIELVQGIMFNNANSLYDLGFPPQTLDNMFHNFESGNYSLIDRKRNSRIAPLWAKELSERDVSYVALQWVTYMGEIRARFLPVAEFIRLMNNEKRLGISWGNIGTLQNDFITSVVNTTGQIYVEPDLKLLKVAAPMRCSNRTRKVTLATVMSKWTDESGNPSPACPIHALQRHLHLLDKEYGLNIMIGFELEVIFLRRTSTSPPSYSPLTTTHSWGTFHPQDLTLALPLLTEIESALSAAGITVQQFHSESGPGQYEIVLAPLPAIDAIHTLYQARQIVQHVAEASDLRATFHPCPIPGTGNASHAHISLNDTRLVSEVSDGRTEVEMYGLEMSFWAGVLEHLEAICVFGMPEAESYERVVEDHWTGGVWVAWGTQNREVPLRRIGGTTGSKRWEVRCVDGCANMYLAMAAIVAAGYEGLQEKKDMRFRDCDVNPARVSEEVRLSYGISRRLPGNVLEALKSLGEDDRLREMIGVIADDYMVMKKVEQNMLGEMEPAERRAWLVERY